MITDVVREVVSQLPGYEHRPQQLEMAELIETADREAPRDHRGRDRQRQVVRLPDSRSWRAARRRSSPPAPSPCRSSFSTRTFPFLAAGVQAES